MPRFDLLILDFDGTIADTSHDLIDAVNAMLSSYSALQLPFDVVLPFIGRGMNNLVRRSLVAANLVESASHTEAVARFEEAYESCLLRSTICYPGVEETLRTLPNVKKGILSNKPERYLRMLNHALEIESYFDFVIGGDTLGVLKPDPLLIAHVLDRTNVDRERALLVGDSEVDIQTGKVAGVATCAVAYGFTAADHVDALGADYVIESFDALTCILS